MDFYNEEVEADCSLETPPPLDLEDTKRRLFVADHLLVMSNLFDSETVHELRLQALNGEFREVYDRLLQVWVIPEHADNTALINAIILSGMGAGYTPVKIADDLV